MGNRFLLSDLAARIGAVLQGPDSEVQGMAPVEDAGPGQVTFLSNPKYAVQARETKASAVIAKEPIPGAGCAFLLAPNPYHAFASALELFHPPIRPVQHQQSAATVLMGHMDLKGALVTATQQPLHGLQGLFRGVVGFTEMGQDHMAQAVMAYLR